MSITIIERMREHAQAQPDAVAFRYLNDLSSTPSELTFRQLWAEAGAVAQFLRARAPAGSRVMLFFPPGLAYIRAFFGCLAAGMIAVPLYPPRRNVKSDRIIKVAQSCGSTLALTTASELDAVRLAWDEQNRQGLPLVFHAVDGIAAPQDQACEAAVAGGGDVAFLQYTSGSTGVPKGVVITHDNIAANVAHLSLMSTGHRDDIFVNWLPLFHDLGLVTAVLWPVWLGATSVLMAPATFVRDPAIWLRAITRYRGTMCGAPNFAYELCATKIGDAELTDIDLSSWRIAYNAAEPVRASTLDKFVARFGASGFRCETFYPSYGMAEATVFISGGDHAAAPITLTVDQRALAEFQLRVVAADHPDATRIVACGAADAPHDLRVVDAETKSAVPDGTVGEIWFAGPSVSPGYWQEDALTHEAFGQQIVGDASSYRYLRTGDLGLLHEGQVYVTGRIKDLIILRGRNYYPHDIEESVAAAHPAVRAGHVAAFAISNDIEERLIVVAELEREHFRSADTEGISAAIRRQVALDHEVNVDSVVLLRPYKIPMTSSGKIQRRQTRAMLASGTLDVLAQSDAGAVHPAQAGRPPVTATEQLVAELLCRALKVERIGADDNFFELGADSIALTDAAGQARQHFPALDIQASHFFDLPTIASLSSWIDLQTAHLASQQVNPAQLQTITI